MHAVARLAFGALLPNIQVTALAAAALALDLLVNCRWLF
jgi:hypothetical protein